MISKGRDLKLQISATTIQQTKGCLQYVLRSAYFSLCFCIVSIDSNYFIINNFDCLLR